MPGSRLSLDFKDLKDFQNPLIPSSMQSIIYFSILPSNNVLRMCPPFSNIPHERVLYTSSCMFLSATQFTPLNHKMRKYWLDFGRSVTRNQAFVRYSPLGYLIVFAWYTFSLIQIFQEIRTYIHRVK